MSNIIWRTKKGIIYFYKYNKVIFHDFAMFLLPEAIMAIVFMAGLFTTISGVLSRNFALVAGGMVIALVFLGMWIAMMKDIKRHFQDKLDEAMRIPTALEKATAIALRQDKKMKELENTMKNLIQQEKKINKAKHNLGIDIQKHKSEVERHVQSQLTPIIESSRVMNL